MANPSDSSVSVHTSVQGFRQTDAAGNLAYYNDPVLSSAITPSLVDFELGARQAVRVAFTVDPAKLPGGGVYAAIFFQTVPPGQSSTNSFVRESAKVGTLLILNNGNRTAAHGTIKLSASWLQLGHGLSGQVRYSMPAGTVGTTPKLASHVYPWGHATAVTSGLVLPGVTRQFEVKRPGSYFGLVPLELSDGTTTTATLVVACTGWYRWLLGLLLIAGAGWWYRRRRQA